jgi:DNA-binding transcriptional regulator YiaG
VVTRAQRVLWFWEKVDREGKTTTECWEWQGAMLRGGYGIFRWGRNENAHRLAYELVLGPIPEGHEVHHTCNNRGCVNPFHMETLTHQEHTHRTSGIALTMEDAREIQRRYAAGGISQDKLAREYGISQSLVRNILHYREWE